MAVLELTYITLRDLRDENRRRLRPEKTLTEAGLSKRRRTLVRTQEQSRTPKDERTGLNRS